MDCVAVVALLLLLYDYLLFGCCWFVVSYKFWVLLLCMIFGLCWFVCCSVVLRVNSVAICLMLVSFRCGVYCFALRLLLVWFGFVSLLVMLFTVFGGILCFDLCFILVKLFALVCYIWCLFCILFNSVACFDCFGVVLVFVITC